MSSLRFIYGPSGSGKSTTAFKEFIARAKKEPNRNFLVIVPDQFTMETQQSFVKLCGGILNIDVLSFGRLTHRILLEMGKDDLPVLDDTGKCLILQKLASGMEKELPVLGRNLRKQGYIHEAKSIISEFMQYGITPEKVEEITSLSKERGVLAGKLLDLQKLYKAFKEYLSGNYVTREEKLDILRQSIPESTILRDSVLLFDGFTGFTPIQLYVLQDLLTVCQEMIVTLVMGEGLDLLEDHGEQSLFHLSEKTARDLCKAAEKIGAERGEDIVCTRRKEKAEFAHLERNLFRFPPEAFSEKPEDFFLMEMRNPAKESHFAALETQRLVREAGLEYRNIAVVSGDLESYGPYLRREFEHLDIPFFLDQTSGIRFNPLVEAIRSSLLLFENNFSVEAMSEYLHCGLADISREEADLLQDYIQETGVRGQRVWSRVFTRKTRFMDSEDETELLRINSLREHLMQGLSILALKNKDTVSSYVNCLYDFLVATRVEKKLLEMQNDFESSGDLARAREYAQVYPAIMELLDQVILLLGDEEITRKEFREILDAGFGEIRIGTIPQSVDRVVIGDLERTRLKQIDALIILGINDGNVPKLSGKGGILSQLDREFLYEAGIELAPTAREEMYSQRLYLYMGMTKQEKHLIVGWSAMDNSGKSIRPSYLVDSIKELFPKIVTKREEDYSTQDRAMGYVAGLRDLAEGLRRAKEYSTEKVSKDYAALYASYEHSAERELLEEAAFSSYEDQPILKKIISSLYGDILKTSVSQLETYGACAYRYFLKYGLSLQEKQLFEINYADTGSMYHKVLKLFSDSLKEHGMDWTSFTAEYAKEEIHRLLGDYAAQYKSAVFFDSARNSYNLRLLEKTLNRAVLILQYQMRKGEFLPIGFEIPFRKTFLLENPEDGSRTPVELRGSIDRADLARGEKGFYLRIIDFKSGDKSLDLSDVLDGKSLQLPLYMNQELTHQRQLHQEEEVFPASMLYFHLDDPILDFPGDADDETVQDLKRKNLTMKGQLLYDEEAIGLSDYDLKGMPASVTSDVIPLSLSKDGLPKKGATILEPDEMDLVLEHSDKVTKKLVQEILDGKISINPYEKGSCEYCAYKGSCPFDQKISGYEKRDVEKTSQEDVLERLRMDLRGENS